jgi:hypothetical protein
VVELAPGARSAVPFSLMTRILPVNPITVRRGRSLPEGGAFVAYPAIIADTLAFIPYPLVAFQASAPMTLSPTQALALQRNQDYLLAFAREWVQTARESADAWEALAECRDIAKEAA